MSRIAFDGVVRQREPRVRDKVHLGKVAKLPCLPCLVRGTTKRPVEVAHIKTGYPEAGWRHFGNSEKSHDWRTAPICASCHRAGAFAQHMNRGGGEAHWWRTLNIYPPTLCAELVAAFRRGETGERVLVQAAGGQFKHPE